jgi:hypothetical protein
MNTRWRLPTLAIILAAHSGCASNPLGFTRSEWEALPAAKQAEYRTLQKLKDGQDATDATRARIASDQLNHEPERRNAAP